jgi:pimeloyl-ACP methyl ester carboxylesterase
LSVKIGYSLGGGVALQTAIRHPEVVRKLALASIAFTRSSLAVLPATTHVGWAPPYHGIMTRIHLLPILTEFLDAPMEDG